MDIVGRDLLLVLLVGGLAWGFTAMFADKQVRGIGIGFACIWLVIGTLVGLGSDEVGAGFMVAVWLPIIIAGVIGAYLSVKRDERLQADQRLVRREIPRDARTLGRLWYIGGAPGLVLGQVDIVGTPEAMWLAPREVAARPLKIPVAALMGLRVQQGQQVFTRTDIVGGLLWGGGGARRTESADTPSLLIAWRIGGSDIPHEIELRALQPGLENTPASSVALPVLRSVHSRIIELLGQAAVAAPTETDVVDTVVTETPDVGCPWCAEPIRREARICRHCRREVESGRLMV